jgi:hypothetical protein
MSEKDRRSTGLSSWFSSTHLVVLLTVIAAILAKAIDLVWPAYVALLVVFAVPAIIVTSRELARGRRRDETLDTNFENLQQSLTGIQEQVNSIVLLLRERHALEVDAAQNAPRLRALDEQLEEKRRNVVQLAGTIRATAATLTGRLTVKGHAPDVVVAPSDGTSQK